MAGIFGVLIEQTRMNFAMSSWPYPVRNSLARQIMFSGVWALRIAVPVSMLLGVVLYLQISYWLNITNEMGLLSSIIASILINEFSPLFSALIIVIASASAMSAEIAGMSARGEVRLIQAQGINIYNLLVMPRMWGLAISVFCLAVIISMLVLLVVSIAMFTNPQLSGTSPWGFILEVFGYLKPVDGVFFTLKTLASGFVVGYICTYKGLGVSGAVTNIPVAVSRSVVLSYSAIIVIAFVFSIMRHTI